ncbi:hypothetical protein cypCar_00004517 [Cyprinus carpio]|nr:hypothetical protein cypCar_00004517 [Cyprinus carpio]
MSSSQTLAVEEEEVLGSFDFLSADCNEDEISNMGSIRLGYTGIGSFNENTLKSMGLLSQDKTSPTSEDTGEGEVRQRGDAAVKPSLSTGVYSLDQALETHLSVCTVLLGIFFPMPFKVFSQLLHQVQCSCMMASVTQCTTDRVTVFQLLVYLNRWSIIDFGEHISLLSKEVYLIASLESPKRRRALKKLKGKRISELQPTGRTLQLLAKLQTDANHKVASAAASCLSRASRSKSFRAKAVVHYTDLLRNSNTHVRHVACLALKCLKGSESAEQVAELWRSTDEDLRNAARETVLSFGKKGHMAFQRMDQIYELQDEAYKNLETEITIL